MEVREVLQNSKAMEYFKPLISEMESVVGVKFEGSSNLDVLEYIRKYYKLYKDTIGYDDEIGDDDVEER